ncbi:MAG: CHAT domain-containing protein [Promethearchaeota archaeon]|nr:MAG: CHAT domain-containing protein [Candidatus Lokiarchaeota archaeon]
MTEIDPEDIKLIKLELRILLKRLRFLIRKIEKEIDKLKFTIAKLHENNKEDEAKLVFYTLMDNKEYLNQLREINNKYFEMHENLKTQISNDLIEKIKKELYLEEKEKGELAKEKREEGMGGGTHFKWLLRKKPPLEITKSIKKILEKDIPKQVVEVPTTSEELAELEGAWEDYIEKEAKSVQETLKESEKKSKEITKRLEELKEELSMAPPPAPKIPSGSAPEAIEEPLETELEEEPEPSTGDVEVPKPIEEPKSIKRFADINAEKKMEVRKENLLTVQLKRDATTVVGTIVMLNIPLKLEQKIPEIDIFVVSPGMEIPENRKTMKVPLDSDSDIIEFIIIPKELGKHYIFVEFYQESKMLGRAILDVEVKKKIKKPETLNKEFKFNMVRDTNIDATLRIIRYGNEFIFSLFTKHGGTILDPKSTFGTMKVKEKYINNLNSLIREVAFDFDNPERSLEKIIKLGEKVYQIIPESIRNAINKINPKYLIFETGDLFVPFELAYDGEDFLCLKYCIGKRILDENKDFSSPPVCFGTPDFDFILIESNPRHDLQLKERQLISELIKDYRINFTTLMGKNANRKILNKLLIQPLEIVHFAGHGMFDKKHPDKSGLLMSDGVLTAEEIKNIEINGYPLIFINACEAATIKKVDKLKGVGGIARAFLGSGAIGFVGPLWEITDDLAAEFANDFYTKMIKNNLTVGEAIREVKKELKEKYSHILWATFNYYGDPTLHLCPQINI